MGMTGTMPGTMITGTAMPATTIAGTPITGTTITGAIPGGFLPAGAQMPIPMPGGPAGSSYASYLKAGSVSDDLFQMGDRNKDGAISKSEFKTALKGGILHGPAGQSYEIMRA